MERDVPRGGGQDATIAAVVAGLLFVGTFVAYYYLALKPKLEEIASLETSKQAKISELKSKLDVIKEQKNYEVRLAVLHDQWDENKHWFINGLIDWTDREQVGQTQFNIFQLYERMVDIARASGIDVEDRSTDDHTPFVIEIDEEIKFYLDDKPYDFPNEYFFLMEDLTFEPAFRFPKEGEGGGLGSVTTEGKSLFNAHNFSIQFQAPYEVIARFAKNIQQRFGQEDTLVAVHCFSTDSDPRPRRFTSPFSPISTTSVEISIQMYCTAYSIFDAPGIAINTPPNLPGEAACESSGGGSRGGGGGGGGGGSSGGGGISLSGG